MLKRLHAKRCVKIIIAAAFARLCVETTLKKKRLFHDLAAAFARLCVETVKSDKSMPTAFKQPPSRGCVLKLFAILKAQKLIEQPPSRGCVLKHDLCMDSVFLRNAAAFARLCVETFIHQYNGRASSTERV